MQAEEPNEARPRWTRGELVRRYRRARDAYALVFVFIVVTIVLTSLIPYSGLGGVLLTAMQALTLLLALRTSGVEGTMLWAVRSLAVLVVLIVLASEVTQNTTGVAYYVVMAVLIVGAQVAIVSRLVRQPTIAASTVMGALSVYLLIGLLFATLVAFYDTQVGPFFAQQGVYGMTDMLYYAFITLTTVGYGDLTPGPNVARVMAVTVALFGQLYLVTVISLVVGNLGRASELPRHRRQRNATEGAEDPTTP